MINWKVRFQNRNFWLALVPALLLLLQSAAALAGIDLDLGALQEKGEQRAVGRRQVHLTELREQQRIQRHKAQRNQKYQQQRRVLAQNHLGGGDGQRIEQLIRLLLPLLGKGPHSQHGDDDHENNGGEVQYELKIAHRGLQIVQHGADADKQQQKGPEDIGRHGIEILPQLVFEYRFHASSSFSAVSAGACSGVSASSRNTSSRSALAIRSSARSTLARAKAPNSFSVRP